MLAFLGQQSAAIPGERPKYVVVASALACCLLLEFAYPAWAGAAECQQPTNAE